MSSTTPDVAAALLAAAAVLPAHFEAGDGLRIEPLSAIQATTLSLPGGAIAVESVVKDSELIGSVVLIIPGLVNHKDGEILNRDDARTAWTAALGEVLTTLGEQDLGVLTSGQMHLTDAFDALEGADEAEVVGVFQDTTLAAILLVIPATTTGEGAAAQVAAAVAAATKEAEAAEAAAAAEQSNGATAEYNGQAGAPAAAQPGPAPASPQPAPQPAAAAAAQAAQAAQTMPGAPGVPGAPDSADAVVAAQTAAAAAAAAAAPMMTPVTLQPLYGDMPLPVDPRRIDLLRDVLMGVSVELGRARMTVQQILGLTPGSIVELDRPAGAPVDVLVNGKLIAHGEVVVVDEEFAVRISEVVAPDREGRVSA